MQIYNQRVFLAPYLSCIEVHPSLPSNLALFDTQIDSIQSLNFAQNWFNSIFNSKSFKENSIQKIIQLTINCCDSIQYIIQLTIIVCDSIQKIIQIRRKGSIEISWIWWGHHHCSPVGPHLEILVPIGTLYSFWSPFLQVKVPNLPLLYVVWQNSIQKWFVNNFYQIQFKKIIHFPVFNQIQFKNLFIFELFSKIQFNKLFN